MLKIKPKGLQNTIMSLPAEGQYVVLGTAGSGKTTMALLRALHLANLPGKENVLLVTFNWALVKYIKNLGEAIPDNLKVETYHKFARGYLNSKNMMPPWDGIVDSAPKSDLIQQALDFCRSKNPDESTFKRSPAFFIDEINFIQKFGFTEFEAYFNAERIGRASANIKRENRKWIFEVYEKYLELRRDTGALYDWDDLALFAYREFMQDSTVRRYKHVIIDEGQDFSPMMIKSLAVAVADGGSLTFFGDVAQQIYGSRLSWRDSGIQIQNILKLKVNYRNPPTIVDFANELMKNAYWLNSEDMIPSEPFVAEGPKPAIIRFQSEVSETDWFIKAAINACRNSSTAIILRRRSGIDRLKQIIQNMGGNSVEIDRDLPDSLQNRVVYLTTFHSSKGLEFENVFIPYLSDKEFPDEESYTEAPTLAETLSNELKLLYVGVTRSKYGLFLSYSGQPSLFLPAASTNCDYFEGDTAA